jgi:23S rRNA (uracil1939-C5)-methyltransferase
MRSADVTVESIAAGGDGVARADGLVIFVPRTAPGDGATVRYTQRGRFARGQLVALRTPSPTRAAPACPHHTRDDCGGCQLQHMHYDAQLEAKAHIVRDALQRIGRREVPLPDVRPSPAVWRYRRKLTLAMRRRRGRWIAGLHPYDQPAAVFALDDCPITEERVVAVWREVLAAGADLPDSEELRGAVRLDGEGATFVLQGGRAWERSADFFARVPSLESLWWEAERGQRVLLHERRREQAPGASFAQVNAGAAGLLHAHVLERAMAHTPSTVVDAYAGLGDTAVALAERGVRVTAIELDPDATSWSAGRLPTGSRAVAARVEDALPDALPADVVILNPPRVGVHERVADVLARSSEPPRAVVYVSCNPATLARDLSRMPRYRITSLVAFDMFPQTAHVETVCELVPEQP